MLNKELLLTSNSAKPTVTFGIYKDEFAGEEDVLMAEIGYDGRTYELVAGFGVGSSDSVTVPYTKNYFSIIKCPYLINIRPYSLTYAQEGDVWHVINLKPFDSVIISVSS